MIPVCLYLAAIIVVSLTWTVVLEIRDARRKATR